MSTFLTAEWRKLIMAQYAVDPATLTPSLPPGVELDLYQDQCFVSLVGFLFDRVRLKGLPIPFHTRFEEVNLRFYVKRRDAPTAEAPDGATRRGVVFISEIVPRLAISLIANTLYEEPYTTHRTRHRITHSRDTLNARYDWRHHHTWQSLAVEAVPTPQPILPGSVEDFITEHYWGFTRRRARAHRPAYTSQYEVHHPRWQCYPIRRFRIAADFGALYGPAFAHIDAMRPDNILLAEGSAVSVGGGSRLPLLEIAPPHLPDPNHV